MLITPDTLLAEPGQVRIAGHWFTSLDAFESAVLADEGEAGFALRIPAGDHIPPHEAGGRPRYTLCNREDVAHARTWLADLPAIPEVTVWPVLDADGIEPVSFGSSSHHSGETYGTQLYMWRADLCEGVALTAHHEGDDGEGVWVDVHEIEISGRASMPPICLEEITYDARLACAVMTAVWRART